MKKFAIGLIIILFILYENPYIELCIAMLAIALLVYEKDLLGICSMKKQNLDDKERDKKKNYEKIEALYKQKVNNQNDYKFIENLQTEVTEDEKEKSRYNITQKQLIYMKIFCIYLFYSFLLVYMNNFDDICYYMPEIIALFSLFILVGIFLKSKHQTLGTKVIICLMAFLPMLFTGLSYYLSIVKPQDYEYIQNGFLAVIGSILFVLFFIFIKFTIKNRV